MDSYIVELSPENIAALLEDFFQTIEVPAMNTPYLLVSFVFGNSKTNGIIMGVRHELPNKVKDSKDFPGTFYKEITDDHGQRKIYRYVPLHAVADFLEDTQTSDKILPKVLTEGELEAVNAPTPGEVWDDVEGNTYLVLDNGFLARPDGSIWEEVCYPDCQCEGVVQLNERVARRAEAFDY